MVSEVEQAKQGIRDIGKAGDDFIFSLSALFPAAVVIVVTIIILCLCV